LIRIRFSIDTLTHLVKEKNCHIYLAVLFLINDNLLTSLKGSPKEVGSSFNCSDNNLESLEYAPKIIGGNFLCKRNEIHFHEDDIRKQIEINGSVIC